jgi:rhodanese-related sulfurtransferase
MQRRTFLAASALSVAGLSGCLSGGSGSYPTPDDGNTDGYPPASDDPPEKKSVDVASLPTVTQKGQSIPLLPVDVAVNWHRRGEARFADARGTKSYRTSHIQGAVLSPAPGIDTAFDEDPALDWPKGDRIVCYCGCPHHLSSLRAAALKNSGYENVLVIDEGFWAWHDRGYPISGQDTEAAPANYAIDGVASDEFAGKSAWARHPDSGQSEAADIAADGSYSLHLKFHEVTPDSTISVETPGYTVEGTIAELSTGVVTG